MTESQQPRIYWSKQALTGASLTTLKDGMAWHIGYIELALHISQKPENFAPVDRRKAANILADKGHHVLAQRTALVGDG